MVSRKNGLTTMPVSANYRHVSERSYGMSIRLLRHELFQPPVFVFQLAQLFHIAHVEPRIFCPPLSNKGMKKILAIAAKTAQ